VKSPSTRRHADLAIVTVVTEETRAVIKALERNKDHYRSTTGSLSDRIYYEGRLSAKGGGFYSVACTQSLKQGNRPVASAYKHIVTEYEPNLVVLIGIAGAIHKDIDLCDVVFADSVWYYDQRKETPDGTVHRGQVYHIEPRLNAALNAFFVEHGEPATSNASDGSPRKTMKVLKGPIGSGEAVVACREATSRKWLAQANDKILALETEAGGLAEVFEEEQLVRGYKAEGYLIVRGISDHADKQKDDRWRQAAADNAMIALEKLLAMMPAFRAPASQV
jgi:adenosylhomocysteine nucleosidase